RTITVPGVSNLNVAVVTAVTACWYNYYDTEDGGFDLKQAVLTSTIPSTVGLLTSSSTVTVSGPHNAWFQTCASVPATTWILGGTMNIRFHFDSVDTIAHTGVGWL